MLSALSSIPGKVVSRSTRYPEFRQPRETREAILDREIVFLEKDGKPSLSKIFFIEGRGKTLFGTVTSMGYEGIMAKRMDSPYQPGKDSDLWLKMKPQKSVICNVVGYTKGEGHRSSLRVLLISEIRENRMIDRGRVGSGISTKVFRDLVGFLHHELEKNGINLG